MLANFKFNFFENFTQFLINLVYKRENQIKTQEVIPKNKTKDKKNFPA